MVNLDHITTARMLGSPMTSEDYPNLRKMHTDPETMATLGGIRTEQQTRDNLAWNLKVWKENGFGLWILRSKETGEFMGQGGLRRLEVDGKTEVEVAYGFLPQYWQQGLATEIAQFSVNIAFDALQLDNIVALTLTTNLKSQRVMQKLGFNYEKNFTHFGMPHVLYRLKHD